MTLQDRLITYILKTAPVTYDTLLEKATEKGYTELEVLTALEQVHKDKRVKQTTKGEAIVYQLATKREPKHQSHIDWINNNYPRPEKCEHGVEYTGCEQCMPFPEIDMSWIVMSPDEIKAFKAEMSGKPVYSKVNKSKQK